MSLGQKNEEKSKDSVQGGGKYASAQSPGVFVMTSHLYLHLVGQIWAHRILRPLWHQLLAFHPLQPVKDSFKNKARIATISHPTPRR